jgi:iron complex transport system ATP-binding protein
VDGHAPAALTPLLQAEALRIAAGARELVAALELRVQRGEFLAVLGRNGCGKTLLLHTLAGLRAADGGRVCSDGAALAGLPRRDIARRIALLPQDPQGGTAGTALDAVLLGRYAHQGAWGGDHDDDLAIARESLERVAAGELQQREFATLSGGEQRRVGAALVLAQRAALVLLDEPTNHLDPQHALRLLDVFAAQCRAGGATIATLHDPTLAARYATHVLLLHGDGRWQHGTADELLRAELLTELYLTPMRELREDGRRLFYAA